MTITIFVIALFVLLPLRFSDVTPDETAAAVHVLPVLLVVVPAAAAAPTESRRAAPATPAPHVPASRGTGTFPPATIPGGGFCGFLPLPGAHGDADDPGTAGAGPIVFTPLLALTSPHKSSSSSIAAACPDEVLFVLVRC